MRCAKIITFFLFAVIAIQGAVFAGVPSPSAAKGQALQPGDCNGTLKR
ncbi:MAG: hypothetical protein IJK11_00215 [Acidaminococcaceae bacterium]|nr:hypothetical protein [Acidaminococcaceae bacterium]MBQ6429033.1 hypothetical protein [Acidaminococcaceae bacterium]MBQ6778547.1 hypothetical protein [Acidaminococcaceae bacterium]